MDLEKKESYVDELIKDNLKKKAEKVLSNLEKDIEKVLMTYFETENHHSSYSGTTRYLKGLGVDVFRRISGEPAERKLILDFFLKKESDAFVESMKIMQEYTKGG